MIRIAGLTGIARVVQQADCHGGIVAPVLWLALRHGRTLARSRCERYTWSPLLMALYAPDLEPCDCMALSIVRGPPRLVICRCRRCVQSRPLTFARYAIGELRGFDDQKIARQLIQQSLRGVADQQAFDPGARQCAHDDDARARLPREVVDSHRGDAPTR